MHLPDFNAGFVTLCPCLLAAADPSFLCCCCLQVIRCALENACSVAKTFLLADVVVTEIPERQSAAAAAPADDYGY